MVRHARRRVQRSCRSCVARTTRFDSRTTRPVRPTNRLPDDVVRASDAENDGGAGATPRSRTDLRYAGAVDGWDRILERQARQLKTLGIALIAFGVISGASSIYIIATGSDLVYRVYGLAGFVVFLGSGVEAIRRARGVERQLEEKRRARELPVAIARERRDK